MDDAASMKRRLDQVRRQVHAKAAHALAGNAQATAELAQRYAPAASGELAGRIAPLPVEIDGPSISAGVEVDSPHGAAQEFGTAHNPAHPFLRPAARVGGEQLPHELARALKSIR